METKSDWLRSEIEKLRIMKRYDPILHTVTVPDGDRPTSEQWMNKGHNQVLTSIITRYKEELKVLESK